ILDEIAVDLLGGQGEIEFAVLVGASIVEFEEPRIELPRELGARLARRWAGLAVRFRFVPDQEVERRRRTSREHQNNGQCSEEGFPGHRRPLKAKMGCPIPGPDRLPPGSITIAWFRGQCRLLTAKKYREQTIW